MEAEVGAAANVPYILTLRMDAESQARFDRLREAHYPAALNRIAAHVTLFHKLPQEAWVRAAVEGACEREGFAVRVTGVMSLGRGVAYRMESAELREVHAGLARAFREVLTAQDGQGFRPHVVVQNKVSAGEAKELRERLAGEFEAFPVQAVGLQLWRYLGGPWERAEGFLFR